MTIRGYSRTDPPTISPGGWINRRIEYDVTLLPQPDSPTSARICPRFIVKETPSTARTSPSSVREWVRRSRTSRRMSPSGVSPVIWYSYGHRPRLPRTAIGSEQDRHLGGAAPVRRQLYDELLRPRVR